MMNMRKIRQSGSVFFALFGAVAMLGVLGVAVNTLMKGPLTSVSEVTRRTMAENNIVSHSRLAVTLAPSGAGTGGDCDGDGYLEPLPYRDAGVDPHPVGGGYLPAAMGTTTIDPWKTQYGYCVWDAGPVSVADNVTLCGGSAAKRLRGAPTSRNHLSVAVISAGKDRKFQTSCNAYADTSPADGNPDVALLNKPANSDDIILGYTYAEADSLGGSGGLWALKDAATAGIEKNLDVTGSAELTGPLKLSSGGLRLPDDPGDNTLTGACSAANSNQLRRNTSSSPSVLEICDDTGSGLWETALGAGAGDTVPESNDPCTMSNIGGIRLNSKNLQICTGVEWKNILEGAIDSNAATWVSREGGATFDAASGGNWSRTAYGNGVHVAIAYASWTSNRISSSTDAINWYVRPQPQNNSWQDVTWGNGLFVAVANSGTNRVMTSPDGIVWTSRTAAANIDWRSVAYGNGMYVATAEGDQGGTHRVMTSPNGITWTSQLSADPGDAFLDVTFGGGLFVAVGAANGNIMTSADGITWTKRFSMGWTGWEGVTYGNGVYMAVSNNGRTARSSDGINWTTQTIENLYWNNIIYGGGLFVITTNERIGRSADGLTWTYINPPSPGAWGGISYGGGKFVMVAAYDYTAENNLLYSTDGITWTIGTIRGSMQLPGPAWSGIAYGNGLFVAVSNSGINYIMTSPDGINWTNRTVPEANSWYSVTYGNGMYVAVANTGTNRVMTSPNGITWTNRTAVSNSEWYSVTFGNGLFVAVGDNGTYYVMTSPDGITWTQRTPSTAARWLTVTYGGGQFVAIPGVTGGTRLMTSPDGMTWTGRTVPANLWRGITYGNGLFVAVGTEGANRVMVSRNAITWTSATAAQQNTWSAVAYGAGLFTAVSYDGNERIMTSSD